jgi:hypothetical protein
MKTSLPVLAVLLALSFCAAAQNAGKPNFAKVPGVIVDYSPAASRIYIGSPSLVILPDNTYAASHDFFGPGSSRDTTAVFGSLDKGKTWKKFTELTGQWWSTLFVHHNALYILGTSREYGHTVIRRSQDGGRTWTNPVDANSGLLLADAKYHCAPVPVVIHNGRLWRAMEDAMGPGGWGTCFRAFMMSAPVEADLLKADNWTCSTRLPGNTNWLTNDFRGWLEGNAVVTPAGKLVDILRCDTISPNEKAAIVSISEDGKTAVFDPQKGFVDFPGGAKKFTIRPDKSSGQYWTLATIVPAQHRRLKPGGVRNTLALTCSPDLTNWTVQCILLYHSDTIKVGFQYVDWQFEGDDIVALCRTGFDDGLGGAHNNHDANFLTFHRFANFRRLTVKDSMSFGGVPHETAELTITGFEFELGTLDNGQRAFANRTYVWENVPAELRQWQFTRTSGGARAGITVKAKRDAAVHFATAASQKGVDTTGWAPAPALKFGYTDQGHTEMAVFKRNLAAGQEIPIPQGNWSGGILLFKPAK